MEILMSLQLQLWDHQIAAIRAAEGKESFGFYMGMGSGKTLVAWKLIYDNPEWKRVLIVCPYRAMIEDVWIRDLKYFDMFTLGMYDMYIANQGTSQTKGTLLRTHNKESKDRPLIVIVNYKSAWRGKLADALLDIHWDAMFLDEAQKIKAAGSKQSRFFARFNRSSRASHRYVLTGTPMHNSPLDVYGIYRFLDPTHFGTNFSRFKDRYAITGYNKYAILAYKNVDEIEDILSKTGFYIKSEDALDLPDTLHIHRKGELSKEAKKAYENIRDDMVHSVQKGDVVISNILSKFIRLQQITSGYLPLDTREEIYFPNEKQKLLQDVIDDIPSSINGEKTPIVVFYRFKYDLQSIIKACENLNYPVCTLDDLKDWNKGRYTVIAVQMQSGAEAISLTRASWVIYYSKFHSLGDYEQSLKRIHRPEEEGVSKRNKIRYIHLEMVGTIDEEISAALKNKKDVIQTIVNNIRSKLK